MKESARALRAYEVYRDMGPQRSLDAVAQKLAKSLPLIKRWSAAHAWSERVRVYDAAVAAEEEAAEREKRRKMREARIGVAVEMQRIGLLALREKQPADISAPAAVSIIHEAHETQRKDLGEANQRVEVGGPDGRAIVFEVRLVQRGDDGECSSTDG